MTWVLFSLGSTITFAVVSALDKIMIQRYVPNPRTFIVLVGFTQYLLALGVIPWASWTGYGMADAAIAYASGLASGGYLVLMFWVMGRQDVSRVIPVTSTYPIFVAILAQVFLGETLGPVAWTGILVTVAGASLMSLGPTARTDERGQGQMLAFTLLVLASLGFGLSQFLSKVVTDTMDVWTLFVWRSLGGGTVCVAMTIRPSGISDLLSTFRRPISVGLILFTEGALVFVALSLLLAAIYSGPVSLASTVMATRPLFVFALGVLLSLGVSNVLNEPLEGRILAAKLLAIVMTVGGVVVVAIQWEPTVITRAF